LAVLHLKERRVGRNLVGRGFILWPFWAKRLDLIGRGGTKEKKRQFGDAGGGEWSWKNEIVITNCRPGGGKGKDIELEH